MCFVMPSLFADEGFRTIISLFKKDGPSMKQRIESCHTFFKFEPDDFWRHRYRFDQPPSPTSLSIGAERTNDLLVNGILPVVLLYARVFKDTNIRTRALSALGSLPPQQENSVTRVLQRQLLKQKTRFSTALAQQGGIQLYKFFCTPVRCSECEIGKQLSLPTSDRS